MVLCCSDGWRACPSLVRRKCQIAMMSYQVALFEVFQICSCLMMHHVGNMNRARAEAEGFVFVPSNQPPFVQEQLHVPVRDFFLSASCAKDSTCVLVGCPCTCQYDLKRGAGGTSSLSHRSPVKASVCVSCVLLTTILVTLRLANVRDYLFSR